MNTNLPAALHCPFKTGDTIVDVSRERLATVTLVHERGFDYVYEQPVPFIAREGSSFVGGTCFPGGYELWRLTTAADQAHYRACLANAQAYWSQQLSQGGVT